MNLDNLFNCLPIRARVAFGLAMADCSLQSDENLQNTLLISDALNAAWQWQKFGNVSATKLFEYVEGGDDSLMLRIQDELGTGSLREAILQTVITAVAYTTREAYLKERKSMPETIEQSTEEAVEESIQLWLLRTGCSNEFLDRLANYLLIHYKTTLPNEMGPILERNLVLDVGHGRKSA